MYANTASEMMNNAVMILNFFEVIDGCIKQCKEYDACGDENGE
jgi:hypothetical protein